MTFKVGQRVIVVPDLTEGTVSRIEGNFIYVNVDKMKDVSDFPFYADELIPWKKMRYVRKGDFSGALNIRKNTGETEVVYGTAGIWDTDKQAMLCYITGENCHQQTHQMLCNLNNIDLKS